MVDIEAGALLVLADNWLSGEGGGVNGLYRALHSFNIDGVRFMWLELKLQSRPRAGFASHEFTAWLVGRGMIERVPCVLMELWCDSRKASVSVSAL